MKKKIHSIVCLLVFIFLGQTLIAGIPLKDFAGTWVRENDKDGITKMKMVLSGERINLQTWGDCSPTDCDWGKVYAAPATQYVSGSYTSNTIALKATYTPSHAEKTILITPVSSKRIKVQTFTNFKDSRKSIYRSQYLKKATPPPPPAAVKIAKAKPVSPCGQVFDHYPRETTLTWTTVQGASGYIVEIDCLHCCESGKWCSETGKMWKKEKVKGNNYSFNWVGANKGRWRVSVIDRLGKKHSPSNWCYFDYDR